MKPKNGKAIVVLVASTKGGGGKSTTSECLLTSAAYAGMPALGFDLDDQGTFASFADDRQRTRNIAPQIAPVRVVRLDLNDWRDIATMPGKHKLIVVDTPAVTVATAAVFRNLTSTADLVIVPTGAAHNDMKSNEPFLLSLKAAGVRAFAFMNRVNRKTISFHEAMSRLLKTANVVPVSLPMAEDYHRQLSNGLLPVDIKGAKGRREMDDLWNWLQQEIEQ